jgi:integrase
MSKLVYASIVDKFVRAIDHKLTARQYAHRLHDFDGFLKRQYHIPIEVYIQKAKQNEIDIYDILGEYRIQLKEKQKLQDPTISGRISTVRYFTEYNDVAINNTKFKLRVKSPRRSRTKNLKAIDKKTVRKIILACKDMRLQTYVHFLAATGWRAVEGLSIFYEDIDWQAGTVFISADRTKTKEDRTIFLTKECLSQLKSWKEYRERERRIVTAQKKIKYITKPFRQNDLFFSTGRTNLEITPQGLYRVLSPEFRRVLDTNGLSECNSYKGKRHKVTLHSFRRFVKTTISNLGYQDFSEWFIGHAGSTYYRVTDEEKLKIFRRVEPYLTYLSYEELEAKGADVETKLQEKDDRITNLEKQMQSMKEDAEHNQKVFERTIMARMDELFKHSRMSKEEFVSYMSKDEKAKV